MSYGCPDAFSRAAAQGGWVALRLASVDWLCMPAPCSARSPALQTSGSSTCRVAADCYDFASPGPRFAAAGAGLPAGGGSLLWLGRVEAPARACVAG